MAPASPCPFWQLPWPQFLFLGLLFGTFKSLKRPQCLQRSSTDLCSTPAPSCQPDRLLYAFETAFWHLQMPQTLCSAFSEPLPTYGARKPLCFLATSMAAVSFCRVPKLLFGTFKSLKPSAAPSEIVYQPLEPVPAATKSRCEAAFWHRPWPQCLVLAQLLYCTFHGRSFFF